MAEVSEELCEARRDAFATSLDSIKTDIIETRTGVGKMLRIVTEGNGSPALVSSVAQNASFRATMEQWLVDERKDRKERAEQEKRDRKQHSLTVLLASAGWTVTIILFIVGVVL